jgi:hypothetical protein
MSPQSTALTHAEAYVLVALAVCGVGRLLMPVIPQLQSYHDFADKRAWLGIPNAADVLSNLDFAVAGLLGLWRMKQAWSALVPAVRICLIVFFAGVLVTTFGSGYYHWNPSDGTLVYDRLSMTIGFAGLLGPLLAVRVSVRSGLAVLVLLLIVGPFSVLYWQKTGDLLLYGIVQFGGLLAVFLLLILTPKGADPFPWWMLVVWYAVAKVFEAADTLIWHATNGIVGGHALKHLAAAMSGLVIANALNRLSKSGSVKLRVAANLTDRGHTG